MSRFTNSKNNTLYLECYCGISGDMMVGALLDLGADREVLTRALDSLPVDGYKVQISRVSKSGIDACDFEVILDKKHENHDHDMEFLHGEHHMDEHHSEKYHMDEHHMDKHHSREHHNNDIHGEHHHRGIKDIKDIIEQADITSKAKEIALHIFDIIAEAEAKAHGVSLEKVHFHEVGAVDSIVDIIAAAVCLDNLGITRTIVPRLCEGSGFVRCQHGMIPVPVPAVANIVSEHGIRLQITDMQGEFVTPTGAAIAAAIKTEDKLPESFHIKQIGIGAGKRTYERPSLLRAMLIQEAVQDNDCIYQLESNIDDCSGEALGFVMEQLLHAGARDVFYTPIYMKKNRPGYQLNVICDEALIDSMEAMIFKHTTTIGIRRVKMQRTILVREHHKVVTPYGEADIKVCELESGKRIYPEYESVKKISTQHDLPYQEAYHMILEHAKELIN